MEDNKCSMDEGEREKGGQEKKENIHPIGKSPD